MKLYSFLIILSILLLSGNMFLNNAHEKESDGVLFKINKQKETDPQLVKIQICTENIIRVIASPVDSFSTRASLMVSKTGWDPVSWSINDKDNPVKISTSKVIVSVDTVTGKIAFYDSNNQLLLNEINGCKIITPAFVMGEKTYHIRQLFESPEDEAFYGLGQHQNGIMNYKGHDVDLWQHNIVAVVPFLVSSKNYGILWDNTSRTKFGDVRDYQPLSSLIQYNNKGEEGGLTVEYFKDQKFKSLLTSQTEAKIEHDFVDEPGIYPEGFDPNSGSIRWSGEFKADQTGTYKFRLYSSGYTKMWLNDELVVDSWRQNWLPWTHLLNLPMEAGKRYLV